MFQSISSKNSQKNLDWKWIVNESGYTLLNNKTLVNFNFGGMSSSFDMTGYLDVVLSSGEYYWTFKVINITCCFNAGLVDLSKTKK